MHGLNHAVVRQLTFLPGNSGGEVFLCPPDAENGLQHCSRSLVPLNVLLQYASGPSLPAASLDGHFDRPQEKP
jgi:hypothetical protein